MISPWINKMQPWLQFQGKSALKTPAFFPPSPMVLAEQGENYFIHDRFAIVMLSLINCLVIFLQSLLNSCNWFQLVTISFLAVASRSLRSHVWIALWLLCDCIALHCDCCTITLRFICDCFAYASWTRNNRITIALLSRSNLFTTAF